MAGDAVRAGQGRVAGADAVAVGRAFAVDRAADPALADLLAAGRRRQPPARLDAVRAEIGRPEATHAALIPIKKSATWWELTQEERRQIFEDRSHHIAASLKYLPAIARQLYHCRDLGEPFDFLTWFEYAPADTDAFEELVRTLRATEEWRYVEREVDIRMERERLDAG
jgi:chlorite dismutase